MEYCVSMMDCDGLLHEYEVSMMGCDAALCEYDASVTQHCVSMV